MLLFKIDCCTSSKIIWKLQCLLILTRRKFKALITEMSSAVLRGVDSSPPEHLGNGERCGHERSASLSLQKKQ